MKNLSTELARAEVELVGTNDDAAETSPLLAKAPSCLFIASLIAYILSSEGVRNTVLFIHGAVTKIIEHLQ